MVDKNIKILVVDDFPTMRRIVRNLLKELEFVNVDEAEDGAAGLEKVKAGNYGFVVSDWNMPNMDGLTMAEKIRTELGNKAVRIVMLTTEDNPAMRERAKALGVNGWIVKPFRGDAVLGPFRKICGMG